MPSNLAIGLGATLTVGLAIGVTAQPSVPPPAPVPIATRAVATLKIPGSADFLVAEPGIFSVATARVAIGTGAGGGTDG